MGIITNKIYICLPVEKEIDKLDWNGLLTEEYNGKTYYKIPSGGGGKDVVKKITFETLYNNVTITLNIISSSENGFDFAYACDLDGTSGYSNAKYKMSGDNKSIACKYVVPTKGSHWIYIGYRKDGSGNSYNDCGYFSIDILTREYVISQPKEVYLASDKMNEITYGSKKILEYSNKGNIIKWTNMRKPNFGNSYTSYAGAIGISYSYTNTKTNRTFKGIAYSYDTSFLKNMLDNIYNDIDYIRFNGKYNTHFDKTEYHEKSYTKTIDLSDIDFSGINNISGMFYGWQPLSEVILPEDFCKNKTDLSNLFGGTGKLTYAYESCNGITSLNTTGWDTSKVTNMAGMFTGCAYLTSIDVSGFDTSNVTNMYKMFGSHLDVLNDPLIHMSFTNINVSGLDTSKVTNMAGMFTGCGKLTSIDVSNFDTSNVTNMASMFNGCGKLTSIDVSNFDTSNVTNMNVMFRKCDSLTSLDVSNWNVSNVTNMDIMFFFCGNITKLDVSKWDTSKVTSMTSMFAGCSKLTTLDLSNWNVSKVTNNHNLFSYCRELKTLIDGHESDPNISILNGLRNSIDFSYSTKLNYESVYALFRGVATVTTTQTITLPKVMEGNLDPAKVKIATDKGWTIAYA